MKAVCIGNNRLDEIGIHSFRYSILKIYQVELQKNKWRASVFHGQKTYRVIYRSDPVYFFIFPQEIFDLNFKIVLENSNK